MIPILTQSITYTGAGIGPLPDTLTCQVTHEINGEYELRMTYPTTGENYGEILIDRLIWATPDHYTREQAFRIYRITRPLNNVVTIYARHVCYDASGIIVEPFTEGSLTAAINTLPTKCVPSCPFTITSARTVATQYKLEEPRPLWRVFGGEQGSMLDVYGGEWDFDNLTAELKSRIGADRGVEIRYGKNLTQLEQDVTIEATYSGIYPYWFDEESGTLVTLPEQYITIAGATGDRIQLLDLSGDFDTQPTVSQLRTRANAYITANDPGDPKISWKINMAMLSQSEEFADMAQLDTIGLGDTVHVFYEPMDLNATSRAVKLVYNVLTERYDGITLGRVKQNLAKIIVADQNATNTKIEAAKSAMERAIDQATDFITHGSGYMRFIYNSNNELQEIVSLEYPDINRTPQNVWRWNNGGFGFSPYGYAGPFTTAITQDGSIVADFITTGELTANIIKAGILEDMAGKFSLNLETGDLNIEQLNLVAQKLNNMGGRNLIENTLEPSVASESAYPKIVGGQNSVVNGTPSTAEHGIRTTAGSAQQWLYFGLGRASTMNGLVAGETYTLSADLECKMLSDLTSGSYPLALFVYVNGSHHQTIPITTIDMTNKGTIIAQQARVTFTVPTTATSIRLYIRCQSSSSSFAAVGDYLELANLKLERGEIATAWTPAPEDQVGNDEIITKINVSPEAVQIAANKISLAGKTIDLTSDTIQITSTNFSVDSAGVITATGVNLSGTFNMTGGRINISTSSGTQDYISLRYNGITNQMSAYSLMIAENNFERTTSIERGRLGVSHYVTVGDTTQEKITSSLGDGSLQLGCASSGYTSPGYLSIYGDTNNRTIYMNGSNGSISASGTITASNGTASAYISSAGSMTLNNGTKTASISPTLAYWYNGTSSKYTALMWPDSNGAGRIILGDGTSNVWRVTLANDGLFFRDANDNVTARYPAVYTPPATTTGTLTFLSGWTMADGESDPNVLRYTFLRKYGNVVEICMSATTTSSHSGWNQVCTIPEGFRPTKTFTVHGYNNSDDSNAIFRITTAGEVMLYNDKRQPTLHATFVI